MRKDVKIVGSCLPCRATVIVWLRGMMSNANIREGDDVKYECPSCRRESRLRVKAIHLSKKKTA